MTAAEIRKAEAYEKALERQAEAWRMVERWKPSTFYTCWTTVVAYAAMAWLGVMTIALVLGPFVLLAWITR